MNFFRIVKDREEWRSEDFFFEDIAIQTIINYFGYAGIVEQIIIVQNTTS